MTTTPAPTTPTSSASATSRPSTDLPLTVIRHERNLGYGGNQKAGYRCAIEQDLDIVVLLHGDGQYAPELLPDMVEPLVRGRGRRRVRLAHDGAGRGPPRRHAALQVRRQQHPDPVENTVLGTDLTEFHSGYRAYSVRALREHPLRAQRRRLQLRHPDHHPAARGRRSGSSRSRSRPTTATRSATSTASGTPPTSSPTSLRYRLHKMGFGTRRAGVRRRGLRAQGVRGLLARRIAALARGPPAVPGPRPRLLRRRARRARCATGATT